MADFDNVGIKLVVLGVGTFKREMQSANRAIRGLGQSVSTIPRSLSSLSAGISSLGSTFISFGSILTKSVTLPLLAAGAGLVATGISFETAFTGVGKTVDGVMDNFGNLTAVGEELRQGIRDLSLVLPVAANELAGVMQIAGQLGVRGTQNLLAFTETAAMLGVATDFSAEQAATSFARFGNIMGVAATDMGQFLASAGSAVVELGNNFAATEPEIINMGLRIAGVGQAIGLSTPQILGISTAMVSMGLRAEMGGSAVSRIFLEMQNAVNSGGSELEAFANTLGITEQHFSTLFKSDPQRAFTLFLTAIDGLNKEGKLTADVLDEMNLKTIRTQDTLNRLAPNVDLITAATTSANSAWSDQTALLNEFNKFASTTSARLQVLKNTLTNLGITIFDKLSPAINSIIDSLQRFITGITNLITETVELPKKIEGVTLSVKELEDFLQSEKNLDTFKERLKQVGTAALLAGPALTIFGIALKGVGAALGLVAIFLANPILITGGILAIIAGFTFLKDNFSGIIEGIQQLLDSFKRLSGITQMIASIGIALKNKDLGGVWDAIQQGFSSMLIWFEFFAIPLLRELLPEDLVDIFEAAVRAVDKVAEGIGGFVKELSKTDGDKANTVLESLAKGLIALTDVISTTLLIGLPVIGIALRTLIDATGELLAGNVGDALGTLAGGLQELGKQDFGAIAAGIVILSLAFKVNLVTALVAVTTALWGLLVPLFILAIPIIAILLPIALVIGLLFAYTNNLFGFKDAIDGVHDKLVLGVKGLGTAIESVWEILKFAAKAGVEFIAGLGDGIKQAWGDFKVWFIGLFNGLIDAVFELLGIRSPSTVFIDIGIAIVQGLWDGIKSLWDTFKNWMQNRINDLVTIWTAILSSILTIGKNIVVSLQGGIQDGWNAFKTWVGDKVTEFVDIWRSIVASMVTIGGALLDGLRQGIEDGWDDFKARVTELFDSIPLLGEFLAKISSPSKVMAELGKNYMLGLQKGIEDTAPDVLGTVADVFKGLNTEATVNATLSSSMLAGVLGSTIPGNNNNVSNNSTSSTFAPTINGVPMQDEKSAGDELVSAWRRVQVTGNVL